MKDTGHHRASWRCVVALAGVAACAGVAPSWAQGTDTNALLNRIERLQNELTTLQRYVYRGEKPPPQAAAPAQPAAAPMESNVAAHLQVRITELENEIGRLTGRNEELAHRLQQLESRLQKLTTDLEFRLGRLEQGAPATSAPGSGETTGPAAAAAPALPKSRPPAATSLSPVPGAKMGAKPLGTLRGGTPPPARAAAASPANETPEQEYERAHNLIVKDRDFKQAEEVLRDFIKRHPKHELLPNAYYWMGRTYYVRKDFEQAAFAFAEGFQRFPKSPKAPANLLNLGMSLARLGKNAEACTTYARLIKGYPNVDDAVKRRVARETSRAKCH